MKEFKHHDVTLEIIAGEQNVDPPVTLQITAPMSEWQALRDELGANTGVETYSIFSVVDDAVVALGGESAT